MQIMSRVALFSNNSDGSSSSLSFFSGGRRVRQEDGEDRRFDENVNDISHCRAAKYLGLSMIIIDQRNEP